MDELADVLLEPMAFVAMSPRIHVCLQSYVRFIPEHASHRLHMCVGVVLQVTQKATVELGRNVIVFGGLRFPSAHVGTSTQLQRFHVHISFPNCRLHVRICPMPCNV